MTEFAKLSQAALDEWRDNPVTQALQEAMARVYRVRKSSMLQAYWAGNPLPESERLALLELEQFRGEFFHSDIDDVTAWLEATEAEIRGMTEDE